jgi:predicted secreted protein
MRRLAKSGSQEIRNQETQEIRNQENGNPGIQEWLSPGVQKSEIRKHTNPGKQNIINHKSELRKAGHSGNQKSGNTGNQEIRNQENGNPGIQKWLCPKTQKSGNR